MLTGGFPCQPYSLAGKRKGKEDERHLWPEMLRAIREISPTYIVGENVYGLVNWNGGMVFHEVQTDLENEGYEILPVILPACAVGAPHRRERIWFVAYSNKRTAGPPRTCERTFGSWGNNNDEPKERREQTEQRFRYGNVFGNDTDTNNTGLQRSEKPGSIEKSREERNKQLTRFFQPTWNEFPTQSPICGRNDGFPSGLVRITVSGKRGRRTLTPTQAVGRLRNESIKAYGNAIVPQVIYQIYKAINQYEQTK